MSAVGYEPHRYQALSQVDANKRLIRILPRSIFSSNDNNNGVIQCEPFHVFLRQRTYYHALIIHLGFITPGSFYPSQRDLIFCKGEHLGQFEQISRRNEDGRSTGRCNMYQSGQHWRTTTPSRHYKLYLSGGKRSPRLARSSR